MFGESAWEELRCEVGAGGLGRADDDEMTFSVKTRVECLPGQDLGHRGLCMGARGIFSRESRKPTCVHSALKDTTLCSSFLLALPSKTQSKKFKINETNSTIYLLVSLQF